MDFLRILKPHFAHSLAIKTLHVYYLITLRNISRKKSG